MEPTSVVHFGMRLRLRPPGAVSPTIPYWYIDGGGRRGHPRIRSSSYTTDLERAKRVAFHLADGKSIQAATRAAEQDLPSYPAETIRLRLEAIALLAQGGPVNLSRIAQLADEALAALAKIET